MQTCTSTSSGSRSTHPSPSTASTPRAPSCSTTSSMPNRTPPRSWSTSTRWWNSLTSDRRTSTPSTPLQRQRAPWATCSASRLNTTTGRLRTCKAADTPWTRHTPTSPKPSRWSTKKAVVKSQVPSSRLSSSSATHSTKPCPMPCASSTCRTSSTVRKLVRRCSNSLRKLRQTATTKRHKGS